MKFAYAMVLAGLLATPCLASGPPPVRIAPKEPKPEQTRRWPLAGAMIGGRLVEDRLRWPTAIEMVGLVRYPDRLLADVLVGLPDLHYPPARVFFESPKLRRDRAEMRRFWMNNQPSTLSYERLNGAIEP
jgi:hypothetical protein